MESSDSIDKSWEASTDTTTTAQRSDPLASPEPPSSGPGGWMVNIAGRDVVEMSHADVVSKWRNGEISGSSLVWREGMENWAKLETVPAFQIVGKPKPSEKEDDTNTGLIVFERPVATLVFDEAVEEEWKAAPKGRDSSKSTQSVSVHSVSTSARSGSVRARSGSVSARPGSVSARPGSVSARPGSVSARPGSVSSRPPAPGLPPLAPTRARPSPAVPVDEPPPPPPLPPRKQPPQVRYSRPAQPTIPGGLSAPRPMPESSPPTKSASPPAVTGPSSPLLAAIAAAASTPEPVVAAVPEPAAPDAPVLPVQPVAELPAVPAVVEEVSVSARLHAMKSVSLRKAVVACVASALVASLATGLVVGSRTRTVVRTVPERPSQPVAVAPAPVTPAPQPPAEPTPPKTEATEAATVEKVALSDLEVEKRKPKPSKVVTWKPPKAAQPSDDSAEGLKTASNPERDDPQRAVPDQVDKSSPSQPANWQADPGF